MKNNLPTFSAASISRPYLIAFCCVLLVIGGGLYLLRQKELSDRREIGNQNYSELVLNSKKKHLKTIISLVVNDIQNEYIHYKTTTDSATFYSIAFQQIIKKEALSRIQQLPIEKNRYLWVSEIKDYNGGEKYAIQLLNKNEPTLNNKYLSTLTKDIKGNCFNSVELEGIKKYRSFFYSYWFKKLGSDTIAQKISYVKIFKPYDWIIGTGVHFDEIEQFTLRNREKFRIQFNEGKYFTLFYSSLLLLIAVSIAYFYNKKIQKIINYYISKVALKEAELVDFNTKLEKTIGHRTYDIQEINNKLNATIRIAEESALLKDIFLANMSHEVRTPMNSIIGFTELLSEEGNSPENIKKYLSYIQESSHQLLGVFNDILDISKLESNQLHITLIPVDLNSLLDNLLKEQLVKNKNQPITLQLNQPYKTDNLTFIGDYKRVVQIFNILIHNAFKYTSKGAVNFGYTILKEYKSNTIVFYVKDTGIGILKQNYKLIFNNFTQGGDKSYTQGNGIGLSIARGLIHLMNGKIWFISDPGKGSTFYFSLPLTNVL